MATTSLAAVRLSSMLPAPTPTSSCTIAAPSHICRHTSDTGLEDSNIGDAGTTLEEEEEASQDIASDEEEEEETTSVYSCSSCCCSPSSLPSAAIPSQVNTITSSRRRNSHHNGITTSTPRMGRRGSLAPLPSPGSPLEGSVSFNADPVLQPWTSKGVRTSWVTPSQYRTAATDTSSLTNVVETTPPNCNIITPTSPGLPTAMNSNAGSIKTFLREAMQTSTLAGMTTASNMARGAILSAPCSASMSRSSSEASTSSSASTSSIDTDAVIFSEGDKDDDDDEIDGEEFNFEADLGESSCEEEEEYAVDSTTAMSHSNCKASSSSSPAASFRLPQDCFPSSPSETSLTSTSSSLASRTTASSSVSSIPSLVSSRKLPCVPSTQAARRSSTRHDGPFTFPGPTPLAELRSSDLEASLRFSASPNPSSPSPSCPLESEESAPPAFFPLQRVSFAPQFKVRTQGGVPLSLAGSKAKRDGIAGMMLGVTGMVEIIDTEKTRKTGREVIRSQRMIADFATDLTNGLRIWRRDAAPIVKEKLKVERNWRAKYDLPCDDLDDSCWEEMLAPGTFMLPLSMKIPCSDKLPPSFESAHFRIRYTMSLALFSSRKGLDGKPEVLHVYSVPFTILPSTLPTLPPQIPMLTHDSRKSSFFAGITRALSLGGTSPNPKPNDKSCTHIICPSIPTSSYSPGSVIPITLRIADCPTDPTDLYIRLSLIRKVYVRDSSYPMMNEWGLPEDLFFEEFCKEEEEIVSRWGYVPYSVRAREGATPGSKAQVIISDITLPVGSNDGEWKHGYSCALDLGPTTCPSMKHGECSWFSPALSKRPPTKSDYEKFIHASTRHFVSIEIGFANDKLADVLAQVGGAVPDLSIPEPNTFTYPSAPAASHVTGHSRTNPFPAASAASRTKKMHSPGTSTAWLPSFPGKVKEILIPVTIGSVAEPQMSCITQRVSEAPISSVIPPAPRSTRAATAEESADRAARDADESESERFERVGDDGEEPWLCPPPSYGAAVTTAPAYA